MNVKIAKMKRSLLQLISSLVWIMMNLTHLYTFYELCDSVGVMGVDEKTLFLRLFPFSLTEKAKAWLQS